MLPQTGPGQGIDQEDGMRLFQQSSTSTGSRLACEAALRPQVCTEPQTTPTKGVGNRPKSGADCVKSVAAPNPFRSTCAAMIAVFGSQAERPLGLRSALLPGARCGKKTETRAVPGQVEWKPAVQHSACGSERCALCAGWKSSIQQQLLRKKPKERETLEDFGDLY
ncbi:hypothetical protein RRG08_041243 [Elysia crispata]|uniref:Uncharacterized protein n=1 Tax=Elysia crispata TaxID=231223 RepID=A0AAE1D6V6_9GAST|nr:hypothetical protein RRG08_041243 [Elysia crispata]